MSENIAENITKNTVENEQLNRIEGKIDVLTQTVNRLIHITEQNGRKMNGHIDFVENVYSTVRSPLDFFKNKLEYLMGRTPTNNHLPELILDNDIDSMESTLESPPKTPTRNS